MADIIQLLPDSIANQIAAGEVIQRPASVVKELVENALDAGCTEISVFITDAGKTLIQVVDNGQGMSDTDARLSFERHATSKISKADDLFSLKSFGFRGEALASIAAIAQVELKTCRKGNRLGTAIRISASRVESQETIACAAGCSFAVKNLFFNVPARRKFLKSDPVEFRHILQEFNRLALPNPNIRFQLVHNGEEIHLLTPTSLLQRIVQLFGKPYLQSLVPLKTETSLVNIHGFVGKPEATKRKSGDQYFIVNGRYIRHAYLHNAVVKAYENLLASETTPSYFIFIDVNPAELDVNIHPTKTEVKFEDEGSIWKILHVTVREALGKFNIGPSIDFDMPRPVQIPVLTPGTTFVPPVISSNPQYNPFRPSDQGESQWRRENRPSDQWEKLFQGFEHPSGIPPGGNTILTPSGMDLSPDRPEAEAGREARKDLLLLHNRFIITTVKSGLMVIDLRSARERILYERVLRRMELQKGIGQGSLFPPVVQLSTAQSLLLSSWLDLAGKMGFDIRSEGEGKYAICAIPADLDHLNPEELIHDLIHSLEEEGLEGRTGGPEKVARALARAGAAKANFNPGPDEMNQLIDDLFACPTPGYSPFGRKTVIIVSTQDIESRFLE